MLSQRGPRAVAWAILAFVTLGAASASAEGRPVALADAVRIGAEQGPGVALARAPGAALPSLRDASTSLARPAVLTVTAGYRAGSIGPGLEIGATVVQDVALRGLGSARRRVADSLGRVVVEDVRRAKIDAATRAALAWVDVVEAREVLKIRQDALGQAERILGLAKTRVKAGVAQPVEGALATGDVGAARAAVLEAEGGVVEAEAELRFALGLDVDAAIDARGDLYGADDREPGAIEPDGHPAVASIRARAALAHDEVDLASAALGPTVGVGASVLREGTGDSVVTGIVSVPLPFLDPAKFDASRQIAVAAAADAATDRARAELRRDAALAHHDRHHWREVRDVVAKEAITPMREALRIAMAQLDAGTTDLTSVLFARQRLAAAEERLANAAAEVWRADLRLERATGTILRRGGLP